MKGVGANSLCGPKSSNVCVIVFTETDDHKSELSQLKPVIENFSSDPVSFAFIKAAQEPYIHQKVFASSKAVLYKPKRSKYMSLPVDSAEALGSAVSDALGGGGSWQGTSELLFGQGVEVQTDL